LRKVIYAYGKHHQIKHFLPLLLSTHKFVANFVVLFEKKDNKLFHSLSCCTTTPF